MAAVGAVTRDNWSLRARHIAELVDADAVAVSIAIASAPSGFGTYASHNLNGGGSFDHEVIARAVRDRAVSVARVAQPLADARVASDICVAPLVWDGRTVGSLSALRVGRPWELAAQQTLARSADLVALELAETHARQSWQRSAEAWQRRVRLLEQVRNELNAPSDAASIVEVAAERVAALAGASGASLMLIDAEGQLVVRSAFGPHEDRARAARRRVGEGISGWVAKHGQPLLLRGPVTDERFNGVDPTIEESLVVPLRVADRVLGVLATRAARSSDPYAAERLKDLNLVAGELAILIAHAEEAAARIDVTTRLENDRREAVAMYDLARLAGMGADPDADLQGAVGLIADAFAHDSVAIWTVNLDRSKLILRAAQGHGEVLPGDLPFHHDDAIGSVLATQRPQLINDARSHPWRRFRAGSLIVGPIVVAGESAGLLVLGRRYRPYAAFDFSLATAIADTLSSLVRREIAAQEAERSAIAQRELIEQMQEGFAEELARVVYVLDACQRLLGKDQNLPNDLARAARDMRSALGRLGIPLDAVDGATEHALPAGSPPLVVLEGDSRSAV
ncbi:MAG TPA: GAF domain-containing protein [Candidatus Acidoferrales bacterium]|nr:GAF domain-containing protein [Candidatus Acidoferrales bacterium]